MVFLAELGDETQLATLSLASGGSSLVFAGSAAALVATSAIAVVVGEALSRAVPPEWLKRGAGLSFLLLGVLFLLSSGKPG